MNYQILKELAKILVEVAKKGPGNLITYRELSGCIDNYISPHNLGQPLGTLSDLAMDNGFPRISALVVNSDTRMPGDGYFRYYAGGIKESEWEKFWKNDLKSIYSCKNWDDFLRCI